ncbi:carbohydrate kinase family protein [Phytopseudomonas dryadis]|uniref:Carbohydrate kinase n=1 Tax=Phytopseudomonas dryadis TaxID=2487520 RepID=A0ABY1Z7C8_9GAMM|nr:MULTISPECIES: carbohydrate kinase [Pseudomonas]TBV03299.1 carbohydrate kinase [Pseudomonas dryadis]TBV16327.1 carbohydrate kinase [Pseudomonas sp. FRB 230]
MYLVCGEALFDFFCQPGARHSELNFQALAGGSPFNVALGLCRLGVEAALFGAISSDYLGQRLRQVLLEEGVSDRYLIASEAPTTLAMVAVDAQGSPQYMFRGEGCADRQLLPEHLPLLDARVSGLHVGSYSLVVTPIADTLLALVRRESGQRLISLDPNVRLNPAPDIALWRQRIESFAAHAHLIKVSEEDLGLLYPGVEPLTIVERWLAQRCQLVFLTRGSEGASVFSRQHGQWSIAARTVVTRDTVGAGDSFQAAIIAYLVEQGLDSPEALATLSREHIDAMLGFAVQAAALTCSRVGPQLPYRHELAGYQAVGTSEAQ